MLKTAVTRCNLWYETIFNLLKKILLIKSFFVTNQIESNQIEIQLIIKLCPNSNRLTDDIYDIAFEWS